MGRTYKRQLGTRTYKNYSEEYLNEAQNAIRNGTMSLREASRRFKIPLGTLSHKKNQKHKLTPGRPLALLPEEEKALVNHLQVVAEWGFPCSLVDLRMVTKQALDKSGKRVKEFKENLPSMDWARGFLKRHSNTLTQRLAQNIKTGRAKVGKKIVEEYFANLANTLKDKNENNEEIGVPASHIFNYDETNLSDDPGRKKCIFKRGVKYPERVKDSTKSAISIMFCGSASGKMLPAYVVYKSEHLWSTWTEGGPPKTRYNRSKSGWFDHVCFADWFRTIFIPETRHLKGKKVLIGDNLSSHFGDEVLKSAREQNIAFVCLPPNSTHLLQPLDVAFFRPLKAHWRCILDEYKAKTKRAAKNLVKEVFPALLVKLYDKLYPNDDETSENITSGFRKTGIHPLDPDEVLQRLPDNHSETFSSIVSENLIELLKNLRGVDEEQPVRRRKKRLNVAPGKSVTDISSHEEPVAGPSKEAREVTTDLSDEENEDNSTGDEFEVEQNNDEEVEEEADNTLEESQNEKADEIEIVEILVDRFYIIRYQIDSRKAYDRNVFYIGKVISTNDDATCNVIFLKFNKKMSTKTVVCSWPEAKAVYIIDIGQIQTILPEPEQGRRGTLVFVKHSVLPYINELH